MLDSTFRFGKRKLESLPLPAKGKRTTYHDDQQRGLSLRVTASGSKTFIVRCRINGIPEYKTLGKFPMLTVENARRAAQDFVARVARGENPAQERRDHKAELTLGEGFEMYMDQHIREHRAPRTIDEYDRAFKLHLSHLEGRRLSSIDYPEVDRLHATIGQNRGKYIANRSIELMRSLYAWLIRKRQYRGENPAWGIEKFQEKPRERFLTAQELPRFFESVAEEENETVRDYVLLSLLTGARKQNMLAMRWDEIDFQNATWRIPLTKNQESVTVPLVETAIDILQERRASQSGKWVFPGHGRTGHMTDPKKGWHRILERANIKDLRIHDLRRTMGSWQAINQSSLGVIAKSLGQKSTQAAAVYAKLSLDPIRQSMEQATSSIFEHGGTNWSTELKQRPK